MTKLDDRVIVSICMITYNHEKYITDAINSILMQKVNFKYKIIVSDDCSTDNTQKILIDFATKYPEKFHLILHERNVGSMLNFSNTLKACTGKYVAILEGDDYWTDCNKIQKQVDFLEQHLEYVITYTDSQPFDEHGNVDINFGGATRDVSSDELKRSICLYTLTTCFRHVIKEIPYDLLSARFGDLVMWSLLGAHGKGKYLANISPAFYRVHDGGVHSKKSEQHKIEMSLITNNALLAYYSRLGDVDSVRYFREYSFRLSRKSIGCMRLGIMLIGILIGKIKKSLNGLL